MVAEEVDPEYLDQTIRKKLRYVMLFLGCTFVISNYFCYDLPACIQIEIEKHFTANEYSFLYIGYAIPNCIMPIVSTVLVKKIG